MIPTASSASASVRIIGGRQRSVVGPAERTSTPAFCKPRIYFVARSRSSIPTISPRPRTSRIFL
jgi:hypothetical protein